MSDLEWKPGDVVALGDSDLRGFVTERNGRVRVVWPDHSDNEVAVVAARPLVVIDPENREQVERLREIASDWADRVPYSDMREAGDMDHTDAMQAALREFANPTPDEPTGLGAVVEDADGDRWVRTFPDGGPAKWRVASLDLDREPWAVWSAIRAVRVLSEGVQS